MTIKDAIKKKVDEWKKEAKENAKFKTKLRAKLKEERKKAIMKESIIQERERVKRQIKARYNPQRTELGAGMSPVAHQLIFGEAPKQQARVIRQEIKKSRKKGKKKRYRTVVVKPKQAQAGGIPDLIWKY